MTKSRRPFAKGKTTATAKAYALDEGTAQELLSLQNALGLPDGRMPEDEGKRRLVIAMHEAGHAVVGHVLGRRLRGVSICEHCEFEAIGNPSETDHEVSIKIALAGLHAEALFLDCGHCTGGGSDLLIARNLAKELSVEWEGRLQRLSDKTGRLLLEHEAGVRAVAKALMKPGALLNESALLAILTQ